MVPRSILHSALVLATVGAVLVAAPGCAGSRELVGDYTVSVPAGTIPSADREFRAAWIATVANIDWPSRPGLPIRDQQHELRAMLQQAAAMRLNAVVLQVRPAADAFYRDGLEPVSYYLTGVEGADPGWDPLEFAVEEAHGLGLELHAWFNPYRAGHPTGKDPSSGHVRVAHPDWVVRYGDLWWLDPGHPGAREHSLRVIEDVVRRYDLDGIHVDDYFYPYPVQDSTGRRVEFPDSLSRRAAVAAGESRPVDEWRRHNVDVFIRAMYERTKAIKPWVKVGISPFGIWRPGHPEGIRGFDQYEGLYADARLWLREGWVDYFTPQLYWALDSSGQPYEKLLAWWVGENVVGRHLWPGNYVSRVIPAGGGDWTAGEIVGQVETTRRYTDGNVHFSMRALMPGPGLDAALSRSVYRAPALVPATDWLGGSPPGVPTAAVRLLGSRTVLDLRPSAQGDEPFAWHVRLLHGKRWTIRVLPGHERAIPLERLPDRVVVSAVNRLGQEGPNVDVRP